MRKNNKDVESIAIELQENAEKEIVDNIKEEFKISSKQLKLAAMSYITEFESLQTKISNFEAILKRQSQLRNANRDKYDEIDEYIQNKQNISRFLNSDAPKRLYEASFKFQNILNLALGQKVVMVYVFDDGTGPELYEINSEDILKFDYSSGNRLVARYNVTKENMKSSLTKLQLDADFHFNYPNLKKTYKEVIYRYRVSRSKGHKIVLWQIPQKVWHAMKVSAEGDINEAYASIVLLNRYQPSFNNTLEYNIEEFLGEVAQVDNISGLLQGDVTKGNIEYGIKSAQASTLSLKQIINLAKQIVSDDNFSIEKLKAKQEEFRQKGRLRNKIIDYVDSKYEEIINDFDKDLKRNK